MSKVGFVHRNSFKCRLVMGFLSLMTAVVVSPQAYANKSTEDASLPLVLPKYPVVGALMGDVKVVAGKTESAAEAKKGVVLREKALFRTGAESYARVDLSKDDFIFIYPNTQLDLPVIDFEHGEVEYIFLGEGEIRLVIESDKSRVLRSPLFDDAIGRGDYFFQMKQEAARFTIEILKGSLSFRGKESEKYMPLFEKDRAFFQGVIEAGEIAYDVLMHGKRVAKGAVGKIEKIPDSRIEDLQKPLRTLLKTYVAPKKVVDPDAWRAKDPSTICKEPYGRLNECAWVCIGAKKGAKDCKPGGGRKCLRRRCAASGQWADPYELTTKEWRCEARPLIAPCDY